MNDDFLQEVPRPYDPLRQISMLELPEGTRTLSAIARLFMRDERAYDPLWRYVSRVDLLRYLGQTGKVRFGDHTLGLRAPNRIPAFIDFLKENIYLGRKLIIPFASLRALLVGHGIMPGRKIPVFVIMIKVDGCDQFIPIHRCNLDQTAVDLTDFLTSNLKIPFGIASRPLGMLVKPGSARMIHSGGETPLYTLRGMLISRSPKHRTMINLLAGGDRITLVDRNDPLGWLERWGLIVDDLLSALIKRAKSKYGRKHKTASDTR